MNTIILTLAALLFPALALAQSPPAAPSDLKTLSGQVYKQARVFRVEPDGINYMFAGGMVKVPFTDLPEAIQKQYGYDPKKAAAFAQAEARAQSFTESVTADAEMLDQDAKQRLYESTAKSLETAKQREHNKALAVIYGRKISEGAIYVRLKTEQVLDDGILASYRVREGQYGWPEHDEERVIFVTGLSDASVDGTAWEGTIYPFGSYQYGSVIGARRKVMGYALTVDEAVAMQFKQRR